MGKCSSSTPRRAAFRRTGIPAAVPAPNSGPKTCPPSESPRPTRRFVFPWRFPTQAEFPAATYTFPEKGRFFHPFPSKVGETRRRRSRFHILYNPNQFYSKALCSPSAPADSGTDSAAWPRAAPARVRRHRGGFSFLLDDRTARSHNSRFSDTGDTGGSAGMRTEQSARVSPKKDALVFF